MNKVRWGILSTAEIATSTVIPAMKKARNAEVVAIASLSGKEKDAAENLDIPKTYSNYEDLLQDPGIDAVYIPLPNHLHTEWTIKAAKMGKHVLCEKPAALNAEAAAEMVRVCEENHVHFMEAFMYQFHPQHQRVKEIIADGEIGDVKHMRAGFSFYLDNAKGNIRVDPKKGGGSIYDVGCYCIHSIRHILGLEPKDVKVHPVIDPDYQVDTSAYVYMTFENGLTATFDCSFDMALRSEYEIIGTNGRIVVPFAYRPDINGGEGIIIVEKDGVRKEEKVMGHQYVLEIEHLSECIIENKTPINTGENTINNMRVIDNCYQTMFE